MGTKKKTVVGQALEHMFFKMYCIFARLLVVWAVPHFVDWEDKLSNQAPCYKVEGSGMLVLASQHGRAHTMEGRMATGARVFGISEVFYYGQYKRRGHSVDITE